MYHLPPAPIFETRKSFIVISLRFLRLRSSHIDAMCLAICRVQNETKLIIMRFPSEAITSNYLLDPNSEFCLLSLHLNQRMEWSAKWENEIIYDRQSKSGMSDAYLNEDNEFWIKELLKFPEIDWNLYAGSESSVSATRSTIVSNRCPTQI